MNLPKRIKRARQIIDNWPCIAWMEESILCWLHKKKCMREMHGFPVVLFRSGMQLPSMADSIDLPENSDRAEHCSANGRTQQYEDTPRCHCLNAHCTNAQCPLPHWPTALHPDSPLLHYALPYCQNLHWCFVRWGVGKLIFPSTWLLYIASFTQPLWPCYPRIIFQCRHNFKS